MKRITSQIQMSEWRKNGLKRYNNVQVSENDYQPPLASRIDPQKPPKKYVWILTVDSLCVGIFESSIKAKDFICKNFPTEFHDQEEFVVSEFPLMNITTPVSVIMKKVAMNEFIPASTPS